MFLGCMWISRGSRLPFLRLQEAQAATMLSQVEAPPRERGMTWSTVRPDFVEPQYWQVQESRRALVPPAFPKRRPRSAPRHRRRES